MIMKYNFFVSTSVYPRNVCLDDCKHKWGRFVGFIKHVRHVHSRLENMNPRWRRQTAELRSLQLCVHLLAI